MSKMKHKSSGEDQKPYFYIVAIVAVVAIVAMIMMIKGNAGVQSTVNHKNVIGNAAGSSNQDISCPGLCYDVEDFIGCVISCEQVKQQEYMEYNQIN